MFAVFVDKAGRNSRNPEISGFLPTFPVFGGDLPSFSTGRNPPITPPAVPGTRSPEAFIAETAAFAVQMPRWALWFDALHGGLLTPRSTFSLRRLHAGHRPTCCRLGMARLRVLCSYQGHWTLCLRSLYPTRTSWLIFSARFLALQLFVRIRKRFAGLRWKGRTCCW